MTPPEKPIDPVTVFLIREAQHVGVVFEHPDGAFVEYGYGDWDWYATMADQWYYVFDTILWPTQGTLGYRRFPSRASFESKHRVASRTPIRVSRANAAALVAEFRTAITRGTDEQLYSSAYDMTFVKSADGYWFGYNCYDAVAVWLRRLGCHVSWVPIRLGLGMAGE